MPASHSLRTPPSALEILGRSTALVVSALLVLIGCWSLIATSSPVRHDVMHVAFGVVGLLLARTTDGAQRYLIIGGTAYLGLNVASLTVAQSNSTLRVTSTPGSWLPLAGAITMILLGLVLAVACPSPSAAPAVTRNSPDGPAR